MTRSDGYRTMAARARALMLAIAAAGLVGAIPAAAQTLSLGNSFYVPQVGSTLSPTEGAAAVRYFRTCPNNDGGASLPLNARIKITLVDDTNLPVPGIRPFALFNGGTAAQGFPIGAAPACDPAFVPFTEQGADSIIGNCVFNSSPACPMTTKLLADSDTDQDGVTYITFTGTGGIRDATRKWGHYDTEIPVFATVGSVTYRIFGRINSSPFAVSYPLRIKNFDHTGGLGASFNQGETVTLTDYNGEVASLYQSSIFSYWRDFDSNGTVDVADYNMIYWHLNHNCATPNNP